jgi:hypothetical protein
MQRKEDGYGRTHVSDKSAHLPEGTHHSPTAAWSQVRSNFLHRATQQMVQSGRDQSHQDWPTHVFAHAVAEFLAWLEIYRVQSQMMQNSARAQ